MFTPFDVARQATAALEAVAEALRSVRGVDRLLEDRFERIERRLVALNATTESLKPLLVENRDAIEKQAPRFERMLRELEAAHKGIDALQAEIDDIREVVEPLRGTTERVGRISERLPRRR